MDKVKKQKSKPTQKTKKDLHKSIVAKKKFRQNAYKGLKQELKDKREEKIYHAYKKVLRKEQRGLDKWRDHVTKVYSEEQTEDEVVLTRAKPLKKQKTEKKLSSFHKAEQEWKKKKEKKEEMKKKQEEIQTEREAALLTYRKKKKEKHKKIAKKNYKGQPNMASQMDVLLEKIQKQCGKS